MTIIHKHEMRQKMWEDYTATTDPTSIFSETRGGRKQEGVTNMR